MSYLLLATVVFAWGFSWYAIILQVGEVSALVAVAYRFVLASGVICATLVATGRWRFIPWRDQKWVALLGTCLFSMNFVSFYLAAQYLPSGLLSVVFATAAIFGAFNARLFLSKPLEPRVLLAAALGVTGLALLLGPEIAQAQTSKAPWWAFVLPMFGTYLFSIGNIVSARLSQSYPLSNVVAQGMVWGTLLLLALCLVTAQPFVLPASPWFWGGVVYLALVASLLAFLTYLTLVNRVGTARASYATVLFPILAMMVSTWAEDYHWTVLSALGLALALGGTVLTFARA